MHVVQNLAYLLESLDADIAAALLPSAGQRGNDQPHLRVFARSNGSNHGNSFAHQGFEASPEHWSDGHVESCVRSGPAGRGAVPSSDVFSMGQHLLRANFKVLSSLVNWCIRIPDGLYTGLAGYEEAVSQLLWPFSPGQLVWLVRQALRLGASPKIGELVAANKFLFRDEQFRWLIYIINQEKNVAPQIRTRLGDQSCPKWTQKIRKKFPQKKNDTPPKERWWITKREN